MNTSPHPQNDLIVALLQYNPVWENVEQNIKQLNLAVSKINSSIDVLILPEAFATGFSMNSEKVSITMDSEAIEWMMQTAEKRNFVVCGSLFIKIEQKYFNRFIWAQPNGKLEFYDKRHLFSPADEDQAYNKGGERKIIHYKGWKIFPQICYDLRFPVWSKNTENYDLLINVANWPAPRHEVWTCLLKARAIENQCYVIGVNRIGDDPNGVQYRGDSLVIDAKGKIIIDTKKSDEVHYQKISLLTLHEFRTKFNTLSDSDNFEIN